MDDYPRSTSEMVTSVSVDAQSWMIYWSDAMRQIAGELG